MCFAWTSCTSSCRWHYLDLSGVCVSDIFSGQLAMIQSYAVCDWSTKDVYQVVSLKCY